MQTSWPAGSWPQFLPSHPVHYIIHELTLSLSLHPLTGLVNLPIRWQNWDFPDAFVCMIFVFTIYTFYWTCFYYLHVFDHRNSKGKMLTDKHKEPRLARVWVHLNFQVGSVFWIALMMAKFERKLSYSRTYQKAMDNLRLNGEIANLFLPKQSIHSESHKRLTTEKVIQKLSSNPKASRSEGRCNLFLAAFLFLGIRVTFPRPSKKWPQLCHRSTPETRVRE